MFGIMYFLVIMPQQRQRKKVQEMLAAVQDKVAGLRRFGAAALDLAWVAAGRIDGYWERNISPWDVAAGTVLVREAGGYVTDLDGGESPYRTGDVAAGNETIHRELLRALKGADATS